jgi:hypothetical protein
MYPPPVFPIDLAIADFDGDSHPDVMVVDFPTTTGTVTSPGALDFFRGLPGGLLDTPVVILMPGTPTSIAVGDLDEDGLPDAMVVNVGGGTGGVNVASIVYGARVGTPFGRLNLNADGLRSLAAIDLDGDGHPELVAAEASTYTDQIEVFGRTAPRFYTSLRNYPAGSSPQHMVFTDTNGDGNRDIVACNSGLSRLVVLHGHGGLDFGDGGEVHTVAQEAGLDAGDVNGDHIPDVVAVQSGTSGVAGVHLGKGDGTFLPMTSTVGPIACCGQTAARLVDVNGDGRLDLVGLVGFYDRFEVDLGDGLGHFTAGPSRSLNSGTHGSMVFSDFNEDGVPDAAIACEGGIAICLGMSGGAFGAPTLLAPNEKFVATGDFNRDGHADLISTNSALEFEFGSQISVYLGHGDGTFTMLPTFYGGYKPTTFAVGDLNGDGVPDLAISNYGDPSIAIFVGTGNGTFLAGPVFPGVWAMSLAIADLDGDGAPDLIGTIADAACVRVWPGLGGAQFGTPIDFGMRSHPDILKVADLDRDGRPDLVVGHLYKGTFDALVNQTAGPPVLVLVSNVEATVDRGHVRLVWYSVASELYLAHVERTDGDSWKDVGTVHSDRADYATFEEDVPDGEYDYRLGLSESGQSVREGEVHVSVHTVARLAIDACRWNASAAAFEATLSLATVSPARLSVIDVSGRVVADDQWTPDGVGHQAREIESRARTASGVYWARLEQGGRTITRRVMVLE